MSDANRTHDLGLYESRTRRLRTSWLLGLIAAAVVLSHFGGDSTRLALRYERTAILDAGQYWRLVTGHFVHGSALHAGLNLAGLALLAALFPRHYSLRQWIAIGFASLVAIDSGFLWLHPELAWYVGLSGVLHGALAAGAVARWQRESKPLAGALSAIICGKLAWEQWVGALPLMGDMPVIVDAHLYGAIGGVLAALGIHAAARGWFRIVRPL